MHQSAAKLLLFIYILFSAAGAYASDRAKEQRWAEQITDSLLSGEAVWLEEKSGKFLAIYTENETAETDGAVILLHGLGVHPDWADVIHPLRTGLPEYGWSTLSIQMPILGNDKKALDYLPLLDEVPARIDAAIAFLKQKKINNIILIGHSLGSIMGSDYLARSPRAKIQAFVGVSMGEFADPANDKSMGNIAALGKIRIPVLDLYGSEDFAAVLENTRARKTAALRAGNRQYTQVSIKGAGHFYRGYETQLVKRIRSWLKRYAAGKELKIK